MSNNVISLRAYQKKCTRCGNQILMFPGSMNGGGTKWQALEVQTKEPHKCIAANKTSEITPEKIIENSNSVVRHYTNDEKIFALEKRLAKLEHVVKCMVEGYQSQ
jgi:hypothetical protein